MKTKIVYILVSSNNDIYLEQAYISMFSLKYYMPDAYIVLLTDQLTADSLVGLRKSEVEFVDELIVANLDPSLNAQKRSRLLKTSARNRLDGDFLYIDCDTVICQPLHEIDSLEVSIAACRDTHSDFSHNPYRNMCVKHGRLLNWPIENEKDYFNSGVIYVKDVPETHEFYKRWFDNLNAGYKKNVKMDQPSFAKTNYEMGHIIQHLPDVWNCESMHGIRYLKDAKILHYLCTNSSKYQNKQLFLLNENDVLLEVKRTGKIDNSIIEVIKDPFKGIAETTHCFAGDDLLFFHTRFYYYPRMIYISKMNGSLFNYLLQIIKVFFRKCYVGLFRLS